MAHGFLCQNRLGFGARLLTLKNRRVLEEHSNWEVEEGAEKCLVWTGAACELDVVDAQCAFAESTRAAHSKTKWERQTRLPAKQLSDMH